MSKANQSAILRQVDNFPSLPATVNKVMAITSDPESTAEELMRAILPDPAMCTTILKIANSAFFGVPRQVATLEKAVVVLGFNEIRNIVIGKAVFTSFQKLQKQNKEGTDHFWEHSFTCGLAAKIMAQTLRLMPSELFVAGLIHDIGKLALLMTFPQDYSLIFELNEGNRFNNVLKEHETYSISHDEIGMRVLKRWLFPDKLVMSTGFHHSPQQATVEKAFPAIIQTADLLALMHGSPEKLTPSDVISIFEDFLPECHETWSKCGLSWDVQMAGKWFEQLQEDREKDQAILDIITGS